MRNGTAIRRYADRCRHICEGPWTRDELAEVGIQADFVAVRPMGSIAPEDEATHDPTELSVLGYVGGPTTSTGSTSWPATSPGGHESWPGHQRYATSTPSAFASVVR